MEIVETSGGGSSGVNAIKTSWWSLWWVKIIVVLIVLRILNTIYKWYLYRRSQKKIMRIKTEMAQFPLLTTPTTIYNKRLKEKQMPMNLVKTITDIINEIRIFFEHVKYLLLSYII